MNLNEEHSENFDRYIRNNMSAKERMEFEKFLANNELVKKKFDTYKKGVDALKIVAVKNLMKDITERKSKTTKIRWLIPVSVAASVVLIVGYFMLSKSVVSSEEIFDQYYQPYPNITSLRNHGHPTNAELGYNFYNDGEYEKAIKFFKMTTPSQDTLLFYTGLSYLSLNQPIEALNKLNSIDNASIFQQQIKWYRAMTFLLMEDIDSAIMSLQEIEQGEFQYKQSWKILKQIEKLR